MALLTITDNGAMSCEPDAEAGARVPRSVAWRIDERCLGDESLVDLLSPLEVLRRWSARTPRRPLREVEVKAVAWALERIEVPEPRRGESDAALLRRALRLQPEAWDRLEHHESVEASLEAWAADVLTPHLPTWARVTGEHTGMASGEVFSLEVDEPHAVVDALRHLAEAGRRRRSRSRRSRR